MSDPIADMLTRIRNAALVRKPEVMIPYSKMKHMLATILEKEGYVASVAKDEEAGFNYLKVGLKYNNKQSVIQHIKRVSKPGRRVYKKAHEVPQVLNGLGIAVISTSQGLMTNKDAQQKKVGGEVVCEIY